MSALNRLFMITIAQVPKESRGSKTSSTFDHVWPRFPQWSVIWAHPNLNPRGAHGISSMTHIMLGGKKNKRSPTPNILRVIPCRFCRTRLALGSAQILNHPLTKHYSTTQSIYTYLIIYTRLYKNFFPKPRHMLSGSTNFDHFLFPRAPFSQGLPGHSTSILSTSFSTFCTSITAASRTISTTCAKGARDPVTRDPRRDPVPWNEDQRDK